MISQFFYLFPLLILFIIALSLWSLYDRQRFTRFEGDLKRGLMIWAEPLTWDMRQFLETMPPSLRLGDGFIRKEYTEILVSRERGFWSSFFTGRREYLRYVAYINLSAPESRIELRLPYSTLVMMIVNFLYIVLFFSFTAFSFDLPLFIWLFPLIFMAIFLGSIIFNHNRERKYLLTLLNQAKELKG